MPQLAIVIFRLQKMVACRRSLHGQFRMFITIASHEFPIRVCKIFIYSDLNQRSSFQLVILSEVILPSFLLVRYVQGLRLYG